MSEAVCCSIDHINGLVRFVCTAGGESRIIDFQWDIILNGRVPGIHRLGYIISDNQHMWIADFSDSKSLSQVDAGRQCPDLGIVRIQQIVGVLLKAADYLFEEYQAWLNPEAIRFTNVKSTDEEIVDIVFLPLDQEIGKSDFTFCGLIRQIAAAYYISEKQADMIIDTYQSDGLVRLDSMLAAGQMSKVVSSHDADIAISSATGHSGPSRSKKTGLSFIKYIWPAFHAFWFFASAIMLSRPEFTSNLISRRLFLISMLILGIILVLHDIRKIQKAKTGSEPETSITKHKAQKTARKTVRKSEQQISRSRRRGDDRSIFDKENQTEIVRKQDGDFRMAMLSQGLPGTPEELEGIRAFILLDEFIIGREESNADLWLSSSTVGRRHARISRRECSFFITDLGSKNGTFLDGRRLHKNEECLLPDRCRLVFADQPYYFQAD
jgi:hypothetical protein